MFVGTYKKIQPDNRDYIGSYVTSFKVISFGDYIY